MEIQKEDEGKDRHFNAMKSLFSNVLSRFSVPMIACITTSFVMVFHLYFNKQDYVDMFGLEERVLYTASVVAILSIRVFCCCCLSGLITYPYYLQLRLNWCLVGTKNEFKFIGAVLGLSASGFAVLTLYYDLEYPEIIYKTGVIYLIMITFATLQTKLLKEVHRE
jgi:amino acid transporter